MDEPAPAGGGETAPAPVAASRTTPADHPAVRRAGATDIDGLVRLRHEMFREMAGQGVAARPEDIESTGWYAAATAALGELMEAGTATAWVIDDGDGAGLVACAVATVERRLPGPGFPTGRAGSMSSVFVTPARRRRGLARRVVTAAVAWLTENGAEVVDIHATPSAVPLYRSIGFTEPRSLSLRRLSP